MSQNDAMNLGSLSPQEMAEKAVEIAEKRSRLPILRMLLLAILAGAYIAFGAVFSAVSITGMSGVWPYGFMKVTAGVTFSLGLILVVVGGAELFTGNNLMVMAWINRKITLYALLRNWVVVYIGNFIGSLVIAVLVILAKLYTFDGGDLGKTMLNIANGKTHYSFLQAMSLGILCNILVCLAVWLTYSSRSTGGKIIAIVLPIAAFIAAGFEHSVANMYILPVGLLMRSFDPTYVASLGIDLTNLTWNHFFFGNLLPVTLGNILGGSGFVGLLYALIYPANKVASQNK